MMQLPFRCLECRPSPCVEMGTDRTTGNTSGTHDTGQPVRRFIGAA